MQQLRHLGKMASLQPSRIEYRLFQHTLCHYPESKTSKTIIGLLEKYDLPPIDQVLSAPMAYPRWKKLITATVLSQREALTKDALATKSTLALLKSLDPDETVNLLPRRITAHNLRQAVITKCQLLCGVYPTNTRLTKIGKQKSTLCHCKLKDETVTHLLGECHLYSTERMKYVSNLPVTLQQELADILPSDQAEYVTNLILLGEDSRLRNVPTDGLLDHHSISLRFLFDMHAKRSSLVCVSKN